MLVHLLGGKNSEADMKRMELGRSGIEVSELCLGTMTWGTQTDEADAHAQIEAGLEAGVDFLDTAEMYPVNPISPKHSGRSEEIIGNWCARTGRRDELVIATKIVGEGSNACRDGAPITSATIREAVDGSLKRLQTDRIDLYQLHWPNRGSYMFRKNWSYDPSAQNREDTLAHMADVLEELDKQVRAGKIRAVGLSNESTWGTAQWLRLAEENSWPRMASIQNEYSLLCRLFDTDMAELAVNEDITLLAFSPLAAGYLTGKYRGGAVPEGSRMSVNARMGGRASERVHGAVEAYMAVAEKHGLDPIAMALAWTRSRPFPTIPIFGATHLDQIAPSLAAAELILSDEVLDDIAAAHMAHPMPY